MHHLKQTKKKEFSETFPFLICALQRSKTILGPILYHLLTLPEFFRISKKLCKTNFACTVSFLKRMFSFLKVYHRTPLKVRPLVCLEEISFKNLSTFYKPKDTWNFHLLISPEFYTHDLNKALSSI